MLKIEVLPMTTIRGIMIKNQRPDVITVAFNRERIRSIYRSEETKQKFLIWLSQVANALTEESTNAK